jgi:putative oxidoreductase
LGWSYRKSWAGDGGIPDLLAHAPRGGWPIQNEGELAALFCFVFLFISARGAGIWSVDSVLVRRRRSMLSLWRNQPAH